MEITTEIRSKTIGSILRNEANHLFDVLSNKIKGEHPSGWSYDLERPVARELILFVISIIRIVATINDTTSRFPTEVATFGREAYQANTMYLGGRSADNLQGTVDNSLRTYIDTLPKKEFPCAGDLDKALNLLAGKIECSVSMTDRITSIETQELLHGELKNLTQRFNALISYANELEQEAINWLNQRSKAPDGDQRGYGSFGNPEIGLRISPRAQRWNTIELGRPLQWVVESMEHAFD